MHSFDPTQADRDELFQLVRQLEEDLRLRNDFLGKLSHEAANLFLPLHFILQMMRQPASTRATPEHVRSMLDEHAQAVGRFADELRLASRIARGKLQIDSQPLDLRELVDKVVRKLLPVAEKNGQQLFVVLASRPVAMEGDAPLLESAVTHLIENALRFSDRGGRIEISLTDGTGGAVFRVRDYGAGINAEALPRVFDLFYQCDPLSSGWGVGLAIVRHVAEAHGGSAAAASAGPGQGSEFTIHLPVRDASSAGPPSS